MTWKTSSAAALAIAICFEQGNASMAVEQNAEKGIDGGLANLKAR